MHSPHRLLKEKYIGPMWGRKKSASRSLVRACEWLFAFHKKKIVTLHGKMCLTSSPSTFMSVDRLIRTFVQGRIQVYLYIINIGG